MAWSNCRSLEKAGYMNATGIALLMDTLRTGLGPYNGQFSGRRLSQLPSVLLLEVLFLLLAFAVVTESFIAYR